MQCALATTSGESLDERQRGVSDLAPAIVERERVTTIWELDDLSDSLVAPLPLEHNRRAPRRVRLRDLL